MKARRLICRLALMVLLALALAATAMTASASAACNAGAETCSHAWWHLDSTAAPTNLPRHGEAQLYVTAIDLGDDVINGQEETVRLTDQLPAGVTVSAVEARESRQSDEALHEAECPRSATAVTCSFAKPLAPYEFLSMRITVQTDFAPGAPAPPIANIVRIEGGKVTPAQLEKPLSVDQSEAPQRTPFGVESYELSPETEEGSFDSQAGSHPFQLTTTLDLNQTLRSSKVCTGTSTICPSAPALPQNLHFKLPPGLLGDPSAVPQCSDLEFSTIQPPHSNNLCPADSVLGVAAVTILEPNIFGFKTLTVPVFNLEPGAGEPIRFGFNAEEVPVVVKTALPSGGDYAAEATVEDASQAAQVLGTQLTLWGTPGDPAHDESRGWECLKEGAADLGKEHPAPCIHQDAQHPTAFLTLPTSCESPPETTMRGNSWPGGAEVPEQRINEGDPNTVYRFPSSLTGCSSLEFNPSLLVEPESHSASTPTGLDVDVHMPQAGLLAAKGDAEPALKSTTVTLPQGLQLNPAAANALQACSAAQFGFNFPPAPESEQTLNLRFEPGLGSCPEAAKVGTARIKTPLLPNELTGSLYLATQNTNPFGSPLVLYLVAEDHKDGVLIKLAGSVTPTSSGQLISTFENTPQAGLFEDLKLHFFGEGRASVTTPANCGAATAQTSFHPWSGEPAATPTASFTIGSGPGGGPCPSSPLPFSPSFAAGPTNSTGGAYSPFIVTIGRPDGDQALTGITLNLPPGASAVLKNATPCPEPPQGQEWSCGAESLLGHAIESAGLGSEPVTLTGEIFLTTGYDGAPFGLLVRTHAAAGPFDLGYVNVRSRINVDPHTAAATITTDPGPRGEAIPAILKGVPVQLKALQVVVDRPEFEFNPTNCNPMAFAGTLNGDQGAAVGVSAPFIASGCASLPFHPTLEASTSGQASKASGASLTVKVTSSPGQANIAKTTLTLPKALPSRLTTIQKACIAATFEANPATCPEGSNIGHATAVTPQLKEALTGPAYLVSHGNAAFPDVEFVLTNKEGIELILDGKTDIKKGITYSRFESVPDARVTSFEAVLPEGPHSALATDLPANAKYDLCGQKLVIPTVMAGQNGAVREQQTKVAVTGCKAVKGAKATKLSLAQQLQKALSKCRHTYQRSAAKRAHCEASAHAKFTARALAACRKQNKHSRKKRAGCEASARRRLGRRTR